MVVGVGYPQGPPVYSLALPCFHHYRGRGKL
jgi:hypothetical protein